jgi:pilus assembly protein CpaC
VPTITIEYKQFGVRLTFTPVVMGDGRIRLQVAPEVSELDFTHAITLNGFSIPAITTRNASTTVELNEGQTLAMAGLLDNRVTASNVSTPILGDLPIIGALFRSVRYERDETELVVMITPRLASGMNPAQVPEVPGEFWRYPTRGQLYFNGDLGGPVPDLAHAPATKPPAKFQGAYGFVPATTANAASGN